MRKGKLSKGPKTEKHNSDLLNKKNRNMKEMQRNYISLNGRRITMNTRTKQYQV